MKKTKYPFQLSYKDFIIMRLVAKGNTSLQISEKIGISKSAIEKQIIMLRKQFNSKNITELAVILSKNGLIN